MFTFESLVDTGVTTVKNFTNLIQHDGVRANVNDLVDANADYTKTLYSVFVNMGKIASEGVKAKK